MQYAVIVFYTYMYRIMTSTFLRLASAQLTWKVVPVFTKKDIKKLDEYRKIVQEIEKQEGSELHQRCDLVLCKTDNGLTTWLCAFVLFVASS